MIFKKLSKLNESDQQIYARIDDDGLCHLTCNEHYPEFKTWLAEGGIPQEADDVSSQ